MDHIIYISEILVNQLKADANEVINETLKNENATKNERPKATTEGRAVAYVSLVVMALMPIVVGSFKSIKAHQDQKEKCLVSGEKPETMTSKDAAMFPFIASGALLGLYIFFKIFSKEYVNLLLTGYFFVLGVLALADVILPLLVKFLPSAFPVIPFHLLFIKGNTDNGEALIDYQFDTRTILSHVISSIFGVWYLWNKHWFANNLFGLAFAIKGVELLHLNTVFTGCILLGGLFIYDIFWVFGTDVMVTVAKSFEAPIKLIFPQDFLERGFYGTNFAMLGLGDIVIPGIFLALLLRFDNSLKRGSYFYFYTSFIAYFLGLVMTIVVMTIFNHAQPALLYLVPFCISFPVFFALIRGDLKAMFAYEDHENLDEIEKKTDNEVKQSNKKKPVKAE